MDMESGGEVTFNNGPHAIDLSNVKENFCTICDLQLANVREYISHNCQLHGISNQSKKAKSDGHIKKKTVFELSNLDLHLESVQDVIENYCTICEVKFPVLIDYIRHNANAHNTGLFYVPPPKDDNANFKPENANDGNMDVGDDELYDNSEINTNGSSEDSALEEDYDSKEDIGTNENATEKDEIMKEPEIGEGSNNVPMIESENASNDKCVQNDSEKMNESMFKDNENVPTTVTLEDPQENAKKPKYSYSNLITKALEILPDQKGTVSQICDEIMSTNSFYNDVNNAGLKKVIKKTLKMKKTLFVKSKENEKSIWSLVKVSDEKEPIAEQSDNDDQSQSNLDESDANASNEETGAEKNFNIEEKFAELYKHCELEGVNFSVYPDTLDFAKPLNDRTKDYFEKVGLSVRETIEMGLVSKIGGAILVNQKKVTVKKCDDKIDNIEDKIVSKKCLYCTNVKEMGSDVEEANALCNACQRDLSISVSLKRLNTKIGKMSFKVRKIDGPSVVKYQCKQCEFVTEVADDIIKHHFEFHNDAENDLK